MIKLLLKFTCFTIFLLLFIFVLLQQLIMFARKLRPVTAQWHKLVTVNTTDCGFDSHSSKLYFQYVKCLMLTL